EGEFVLVVHEVGLLLGLRGDGEERGSSGLDLLGDAAHRFHLADAERAPASADEADYEPSLVLQCGGGNELAVVVGEFERRSVRTDSESLYRETLLLQSRNRTLMNCLYIPGSFIPASLRAKLGLPICLNIFFIWAYWRSRLLTSCTLVPEPRAMRLRRLPLMTSW